MNDSQKTAASTTATNRMLPFDVTQEIDPALADELRRTTEPTLTQVDFDDITVVLPEKPKAAPVTLRRAPRRALLRARAGTR